MNKIIKIYSTRFIVKTNHVCMRAYIHSWHLYTHLWMLNEKKTDKMKIESSKWNHTNSNKKKLKFFFILYVNLIFQFDSACHFDLLSRFWSSILLFFVRIIFMNFVQSKIKENIYFGCDQMIQNSKIQNPTHKYLL